MKLLSLRTVVALTLPVIFAFFAAKSATAEQVSAGETPSILADDQLQMQEITDAMSRFRDRDVEGALNYLETATKKNPDLPPVYVILARFYQEINLPQGVLQALETAVQKSPDDPEAYIHLAQLALRDRRVTEADLLYNKANAILAKFDKSAKRKNTLMPAVANGLSQVYQLREDWVTAQKYLEHWLKLDPKNTTALQRLAFILFQQKNTQAALEKLREAKKIDANNVMTPEAMLARFYQQSEDKENTKKWISAALTAAPKDLLTQLIAAQLALDNGQYDEAQTRAAAAMQIDPKSLDAKILRGRIAMFKKDFSGAEVYFEAAHLQSPGNFPATNFMALSLIEQKDETKRRRALEFAESNVRQYNKSPDAFATYGWVLYKLNRLEEADSALQAALSGGVAMPDTAYYAAVVANQRGRKEEAKRLLSLALKTPAPFVMKQEAASLLEQLNK